MKIVLVCFLLLAAVLANGSMSWSSCAGSEAIGKIKNVSVEPKVVKAGGGPLSFTIDYDLSETMTEGAYQHAIFKYFGMRIWQSKHVDLCAEAKKAGHPCPVQAGEFIYRTLMNFTVTLIS
eukprot:TRINITY_DN3459_c0_g1_i2.p1 TRINITY_DN3459_c0_g1~~TRINITY_DN3459_c0_g1_i2.p1  ORF type:complete len:121 (-),score=16.75 TRINITY_DN3459_c0_g1_i2:511-873(-)